MKYIIKDKEYIICKLFVIMINFLCLKVMKILKMKGISIYIKNKVQGVIINQGDLIFGSVYIIMLILIEKYSLTSYKSRTAFRRSTVF